MGYGDAIIGSGLARAAAKRGRRAAFGNGNRIVWTEHCRVVFENNPHIARPGEERAPDLWWIPHYKGHWAYHAVPRMVDGRYRFNPDFRPVRGQIFFSAQEQAFAHTIGKGFVLVEPSVKAESPNKQWPFERWQETADRLLSAGHDVRQFAYPGAVLLERVRTIATENFRFACAALTRARVAVVHEGGLHHAAAAFKLPAVVIFGGHTHPRTTGYEMHRNLYAGEEPCGAIVPQRCEHCAQAMRAISTDAVLGAAKELLR